MPDEGLDLDGVEELDPPIFIGGVGRSGTSLVRSITNAHPRIAIGPELKMTPRVVNCWSELGAVRSYLDETYDGGADQLDGAFRRIILGFLERTRRRTGDNRVGEKTPNNVAVFEQIHALFPESPLVHVVRDGRDVVRSLLEQDWNSPASGGSISINTRAREAAKYWARAVRAGTEAGEKLDGSGRFVTVRYEDLVRYPEREVRRLCAFLGERYYEEMLRFYEKEDPHFSPAQRPIDDSSVGRWREELTNRQKAEVKAEASELLVELGYADGEGW